MMTTKNNERITALFQDFIQSYLEKEQNLTNKDWLLNQFKEAALEMTEEELEKYAADLDGSVKSFSETLTSLEESRAKGVPAEEWLKDKIKETGKEIALEQLQKLNEELEQSNKRLLRNLKAEENGQTVNSSVIELAAEEW